MENVLETPQYVTADTNVLMDDEQMFKQFTYHGIQVPWNLEIPFRWSFYLHQLVTYHQVG